METFNEWWNRDGRFYDPDTEDVPWHDKRKFLAEYAFEKAKAQSSNYTTDDPVFPKIVKFDNGRTVRITKNEDEIFLQIEAEKLYQCPCVQGYPGECDGYNHTEPEGDYVGIGRNGPIAAQQKELERFKALDQYLPKHYAIGDDATATLAIELAESKGRVEELEKQLREVFLKAQFGSREGIEEGAKHWEVALFEVMEIARKALKNE